MAGAISTRTAPWRTVWHWPPKARGSSTSAGSRRGPVPPGSTPESRRARVVPVVKELAAQGITVSIDTMHADVARAALQSGAQIVNDVSGGRADPAMAPLLAEAGVPWVLMHWRSVSRAQPTSGAALPRRGGRGARRAARQRRRRGGRGRRSRRSWSSTPGWASPRRDNTIGLCCRRCRSLVATGIPVLLGASRKQVPRYVVGGPGWVAATARRA